MSVETYNWLRVGHIVGFVSWIAGMVAVLQLLRVHGMVEGAAREALARTERKTAIVMDIGATIAILCGLWLALDYPAPPHNAFKMGAWLHVKLTIVAIVLLGIHGWSRAQIKRFRHGKVRAVPGWLTIVVLLAAIVIIALGANPDLLRKP
jgi:uncharacterized membrane protein